ncbi:MAG: biopolymer transport protein ExbD [Cyclobacteriaceae bacterium]|jgi:biopolymer transport protein ExbD
MTDIIFLLLIFFMLTSTFITPSGLPVDLPKSSVSSIVMQKVSVTITKDQAIYVDQTAVSMAQLKGVLRSKLAGKEGVVVLHCDESVPVSMLVSVASIATELEAKVSIATKPDNI